MGKAPFLPRTIPHIPDMPPQAPVKPGSSWNWQPIETAPAGRLVLIAICKGSLRCPVRGDRYIAMAFKKPDTGTWTLFGQGAIREDEFVSHWIEPELPPEYPEGPHMDLTPFAHIND